MRDYFVRSAEARLAAALRSAPVVALTGPRQSGKTTLLRHTLPGWRMVSLEDLDVREFAREDPRGFLARYTPPLVIDEAQHVPDLFSYLQTAVDAAGSMGRYVLSGSQQFSLLAGITQSLAGRATLLELLPMRLVELAHAGCLPARLDGLLWRGGYPAVFARDIEAPAYYADYVGTYVERDVRQLTAVQDLGNFQRFLRLCAGRTGQLLNLSALANDCGITQPTAAAWMNVLEASFVVRRIAPYHRNFGRRLVKAPRLYFLDTGLCAWLLGISDERDLEHHFARGALFETWVVTEALKWRAARGDARPLYFWRDSIGNEVDLVLEQQGGHTLVEIKAGQTFQPDWLGAMDTVERHMGVPARRALVYGGHLSFERARTAVIGWRDLARAE
ncbi:MAG: ATP-binding protein [Burkholderiales bacterium]|nr:ATP-binding protein [Burkholderiales bacterium]